MALNILQSHAGVKNRLESENPAPGSRPGQIHIQDKRYGDDVKWYWQFNRRRFEHLPADIQRVIRSDYQNFKNGLNNALKALGEPPVGGGH